MASACELSRGAIVSTAAGPQRSSRFSMKTPRQGAALFGLWTLLHGAIALAVQGGASTVPCEKLANLALPEATITLAEVVQPTQFKLPVRQENPGGPAGAGVSRAQVGRASSLSD